MAAERRTTLFDMFYNMPKDVRHADILADILRHLVKYVEQSLFAKVAQMRLQLTKVGFSPVPGAQDIMYIGTTWQ